MKIMTEITNKTPMEDLTIGGNIYEAGNARQFKTGDWRSIAPDVFNPAVTSTDSNNVSSTTTT